MAIKTMQEAKSGQMVELANYEKVEIDRRDGDAVRLSAGTYLEVTCTILPGVIQVKVLDGKYVDRIAFVRREADIRP